VTFSVTAQVLPGPTTDRSVGRHADESVEQRAERCVLGGTGSRELFSELDQKRAGLPDGRYIRLEAERHKAKPYRPNSTEVDIFEGEVYWIVERLRGMQAREHIPVADFVGFGQSKPYGKSFPPHRPLLVDHPL
jgi:hypothetical protein